MFKPLQGGFNFLVPKRTFISKGKVLILEDGHIILPGALKHDNSPSILDNLEVSVLIKSSPFSITFFMTLW